MRTMQQAFKDVGIEPNRVKPFCVICPYCGSRAKLVSGSTIYPHRKDFRRLMFWQCAPCDAYVGCHKKNQKMGFYGTEPLGSLANSELRIARSTAHDCFDRLWKECGIPRTEAYKILANKLSILPEQCHIGSFNLVACRRVIEICNE